MKTTKKIKIIFAIIMIVTGIGIFSYPFISNALSNHNASVAVEEYDKNVSTMQKEDIDALKKAAESYNSQLQSAEDKNAQGEGVANSGYVDLVQLGDAIGYISIPKIDIDLPIYEGTSDDVLTHGIGHLSDTSYPVGGASTHSALSGHRGLAEAEMFTNLDKMQKGDMFYLHVLDDVLAYQVDQILVVEPDQTDALKIVKGEDLCTLVTCTPIGINSHRLLVRGTRVPYTGEEKVSTDSMYKGIHTGTAVKRLVVIWPWLTLAALIAIGVEAFIMLMLIRRIRQSREDD
ncbi:MAG: class C sortase [Clostridiales bacterium]|nr:class C sortase [Clostridiales bacterium]